MRSVDIWGEDWITSEPRRAAAEVVERRVATGAVPGRDRVPSLHGDVDRGTSGQHDRWTYDMSQTGSPIRTEGQEGRARRPLRPATVNISEFVAFFRID